jgi:uncharacterized protein
VSLLFFDSSALVKRYLTEIGSAWVISLTDLTAGNSIILAEITRVEVAAALASRHRAPGGITLVERDRLFKLLVLHNTTEYQVVPLGTAIVDQAMNLTQRHRLRGYDAVQLGSALVVNAQYIAAGLTALTFITADDDLVTAAQAEGLTADNPNLHP